MGLQAEIKAWMIKGVMMRKQIPRIILILLLLLSVLSLPCHAEPRESNVYPTQNSEKDPYRAGGGEDPSMRSGGDLYTADGGADLYTLSGGDELYNSLDDDTKELLRQAGIESAEIGADSINESLLATASRMLNDALSAPFKTLLFLITVVIICRLCCCFESKSIGETGELVGSLACAGILLPFIIDGINSLETLTNSASVLLLGCVPVYSGLLVATGNPQTAATHGTLTLLAGNAIPALVKGFILPALNILLAFSIVSMVSTLNLDKLSSSLYRLMKWLLVLVVTVFFALMATSTAINKSLDEATAKTAKLVVSSAIPVIGSTLGDSLSAILGGIEIVKSGLGAFGILAAIFILLPGMIESVLWLMVCWIGQLTAELFEAPGIYKLMATLLSVIKMLLAVIVSVGAVCVVCISIVLLAGGAK